MIKKTQSQDVQQQQQQTNSFYDMVEKEGSKEKTEMEEVIGSQRPTTFPSSLDSKVSSPPAHTDDVISSIQPSTTLSPPELSRASRVSEAVPGAHAVAGIRPIFYRPSSRPLTGRTTEMEELGLELVPTSQNDRYHDDTLIHADISNLLAFNFTRHITEASTRNDGGLVHADPVDDSENGEIPIAEPITTRAKILWKKKICLDLSLEAIVAIAIVSIILLAFLLAAKSNNQTQPAQPKNGVIPIPTKSGTMASITQAPTSLWERLNLPEYTLRAMENPRSPQTKAYQWLSSNIKNSNNTPHLPMWRLKQRFALATFYYSTRGDYWVKNQGWLDWDSDECSWAQIDSGWYMYPNPAAYCHDNGQLLSLKFGKANNLDGTILPEISLLRESLETFQFSGNYQLEGCIPTEVGMMTRLTSLLFGKTHLSGILPTKLGQLQSLENLLISGREFDGTIPTELGNLRNLTDLGFQIVNLSGSIPTEILQLSNLKNLGLSECPLLDITSFFPQIVGNLHNLEILNLSYRKPGAFTSIPSEIGKLTNLATLILSDFQLSGPLPSEMGLLTNLISYHE
ncbi:Leucine Rich Repeat [Seminavis robusta]|uniref:Leucine Rich Repeat n=1 Tax=Seminavis robusta TaxID=568900 RepID=A0A9N8E0N9_9STRA|nr:Leucine Rich Repeat [Seminavis robusta]|eukprot:Sro432_g141700.1 Leucine Rich Repeat (569) ;mRNA; r:48519-50380